MYKKISNNEKITRKISAVHSTNNVPAYGVEK